MGQKSSDKKLLLNSLNLLFTEQRGGKEHKNRHPNTSVNRNGSIRASRKPKGKMEKKEASEKVPASSAHWSYRE